MSTATTQPVLELSTLDRHCLPVAGGKGANLGELLRAGIPVPDGFVVTTTAYRDNVLSGATAERVATLAREGDFAALRQTIADVEVDAQVRDAIVAAYRRLGDMPVAVRSSGTAEDLADAAFAGQHDTYLNVVGPEAVVDAVRRCWASLWTDRAADYRARRGIDPEGVAIAVVVQTMVQSRAAGVMFTADPVSGRRDRVVVDAGLGLGEAVVSGLVTPDHYVAEKKNGKIVSATSGRREVVIRSRQGGGTVETYDEKADGPVLDARELKRLVALGRKVEDHYGAPQDTEWSLVDDDLYLVQSRPITAIPEEIGKVAIPQKMLASIMGELLNQRPYPLDHTTWCREMFAGVRYFVSGMGVTVPTLDEMSVEQDGVLVRLVPGAPRPSLRTPFIMLRNMLSRGRRFDPANWEDDPRLAGFLADVDRLRAVDLGALSYAELDGQLSQALALNDAIMALRHDYIPPAAGAAARFAVTLALLGRRDLFTLLLTKAPTKTAETNRRLAELAERVRAEPVLAADFAETDAIELRDRLAATAAGREFLIEFDAFLDVYGHREIRGLALISEPVWRDSPHTVLGIIKGMAANPPRPPHETAAAKAEAELLAHPRLRSRSRRERVLRRLAAARHFTSFREDTHFYLTMPHPIVRRVLLEYGARLAEAGALPEPWDVFHLRREDLTLTSWPPTADEARRLTELVSQRAAVRERLSNVPVVDPRYFATAATDANALLTGTPGSAGRVSAKVRIIRGSEDFHSLRDGEILVAPFTNPAWTPLFQRAAAVIVDTGAAMSHAAIVAREYGIPAVLGTGSAVTTLRDGQTVTVDGGTGTVTAVEPSPGSE